MKSDVAGERTLDGSVITRRVLREPLSVLDSFLRNLFLLLRSR